MVAMSAEQPPAGQGLGEARIDVRMQILATEHWSLLATRSLTYTESFSRVSMFFSVLSGAVISLALIAQAGRLGKTFLVAAILVLAVVLFVGLATIARLQAVNRDDLRWVIGMNRLRHAYLELHPELERYLVAGWHDDARGISLTLGLEGFPIRGRVANVLHGFQTLPGMLGVIVAVVAGALGALVAVGFGAAQGLVIATGVATFSLTLGAIGVHGWRSISGYAKGLAPRFPSAD
jgi:hypothetical protein